MALPGSARLPMAFSAILGLCVLGADVAVLSHVLQSHAGGLQVAFTSVFALSVAGLWAWGYRRSWQSLSLSAREEAALPETASKLAELAKDVERRLTEGANVAPKPLSDRTPILDRRVQETWLALRRGAPPQSVDPGLRGRQRASDPERELRTVMDIALAVGITGSVVAILAALGSPDGSTLAKLLANAGPGLAIGLASVIANTGLQLCHRALQEERERLGALVEDTVSESFIANLPKSIASPEDRLANAGEQLAQDTREILEYSFEKHNAGTQKMLTAQAEHSDSLLKEHALLIGQALTKQVQQPIQQLANQTDALVRQSAAWTAAAVELNGAHTEFLKLQREAHESHEAALSALFVQHRSSLNDFLEMARQANHVVLVEMQEATGRQIQDHAKAAADHLVAFREQFAVLITEQEAAHRRVTDAALVSIGAAVEARLVTVDEHIGATLTRAGDRLPDLLRSGVKEGLDETIALLSALREQAAALAHTIAQVSGNADRQLLAYERWQERANAIQAGLETTIMALQAAREEKATG